MDFLGHSGDDEVDTKVAKEAGEHNDILKEDFIDSYHNLTIKTTMMLKFFYLNKFDVKLIFKASLVFFLFRPANRENERVPVFRSTTTSSSTSPSSGGTCGSGSTRAAGTSTRSCTATSTAPRPSG